MDMNICFVTHDMDSGGAGRSLSILITQLAKKYNIKILSLIPPNPKKNIGKLYHDLGVQVFCIHWGWTPVSYINCPVDIEAQYEVINNCKKLIPDIKKFFSGVDIVCFNSYPSLGLAAFVPKTVSVYLIARDVIDETSPGLHKLELFARNHVRKAVAIGPVEADLLERWRIPHTIVYNTGPQHPKFLPLPTSDIVHVGCFGQLYPLKGQEALIASCAMSADTLRAARVCLHVYGGGTQGMMHPYEAKLRLYVEHKGLQDIVRMEGWVNDVERAMEGMHVVVRPDKTGCPWGRDVIEAMSLGRAVIATGTCDVFVKPDVTGWLLPVDKPETWGRTLAVLARNADIAAWGKNAYKFACTNFDPVKNAKRIESTLLGEDIEAIDVED
ncbi:MAG: glycosyltransferase family 4 protein [Desulfovibrio desulfuricans]|nr:glycosyltransferase family 4 protein [Desulfovibrio desulfuricans]